jgi:hypothetical protein
MTVIEALVALVIAFGVVVSAIEASRQAITRSAMARLDAEADLDAEALLSRVGRDLPLQTGRLEGDDGSTVHWTVEMQAVTAPQDAPSAYAVMSEVTILRAGLSAHGRVATLKLQWPSR